MSRDTVLPSRDFRSFQEQDLTPDNSDKVLRVQTAQGPESSPEGEM